MPFAMCETVSMVRDGRVHLTTGRRPNSAANKQWRDHTDINHHLIFFSSALCYFRCPAFFALGPRPPQLRSGTEL